MKAHHHDPSEKREFLNRLRKKAEDILSKSDKVLDSSSEEIQFVFQELQMYQIELEMQNDELIAALSEVEVQKERFSNLFELAPIGIITLDDRGIITDANQTAMRLIKAYKHTFVDKPFSTYVEAEYIKHFYSFFQSLVKSDKEQQTQLKLYRMGSSAFYADINGVSVKNLVDERLYYLSFTEVTEKKTAELKVEEAKKRLELALNASDTGIWEIEASNLEITLDDFTSSLMGLHTTYNKVKYNVFLNAIKEEDRAKVDDSIRSCLVNEKELNIEFCLHSGQTYVEARGQILKNEANEKKLLGTLTNVTEKRRAQLENIRLQEIRREIITAAALRAEEKERKRISEVLHDGLGQVLYATKLNLEECQDTKAKEFYNKADQLLDKAIEDLRTISFQLAPSILQDFGIAAALHEMAKRISNSNLDIYADVLINKEPDLDFGQSIFRIVQELVNNGMKHGKATKIHIEVSNEGNSNMYQVSVRDNGIGFRHDYNKTNYTGSGLSSIRNRLSLYKGEMNIQSTETKGTFVDITLFHPE